MSNGQGDLFGDDAPETAGGGERETGGGWRDDGALRQLIDDNFVQYASYVIRDRAIPELSDGLKPVQRRILHSLSENDDGKFIKVANIVGHSMQYHPHGDASIADALVTLVNKGYLIEGQGNFGNLLTGDPAAASRYIECRLTDLARNELFQPELTRFVPSYDGRRKEPVSLPAKVPLLLMMGADGIAVGLSTRIFPHNFAELLQAQIAILQKKPFELVPDFPQGGLMDASEYDRGNGRVRMRARIEARSDDELVIRSVPYGTTTESVVTSIEAAARKNKLKVRSINDFTAEQVEIQVQLKAGQSPERAIDALYAFTHCEVVLSGRVVVIHGKRPCEMNVEEVLRHNTRQLVKTLRRELEAEKRNLLDQLHHKTLVQIFVENRIYKKIEECKTLPDVQRAVLDGVNRFRNLLRRDVTARDVEMLLGIKIKRISRYDMERNRKELADLLAGIERVDRELSDVTAYAIRYLRGLARKYAKDCPRRTEVTSFDTIELRDLTATELTLRYDAEKGYLGHQVSGEELFQCSSLDKLLVVQADGSYRMIQPPDKLFVDRDLPHCGLYDRERIFTMVYRDEDEGLHYLKRFAFGGAILNRAYRCAPQGTRIVFLTGEDARALYVRYDQPKGQQKFSLARVKVKGVKTRGSLMTSKRVASVDASKPSGWRERKSEFSGTLLD